MKSCIFEHFIKLLCILQIFKTALVLFLLTFTSGLIIFWPVIGYLLGNKCMIIITIIIFIILNNTFAIIANRFAAKLQCEVEFSNTKTKSY